MKIRLRILTLIITAVFCLCLIPAVAFAEASAGGAAVRISDENLSGTAFKVKGYVEGVNESVSLIINMTKNGNEFISQSFSTEDDGSFELEIQTDSAPDLTDDTYNYTISEAERTSTLSVIKEDDFSADSSYTVKASVNNTVGNPSPSMKISNSEERLLYTGSSKTITNDDSIYSVSADVRLDTVTSINKQVLAVSNSSGNGSGTNSEINKLGNDGFNAVKIMANNGKFIAEYADNAANQTEITKKEIGSYTAESWTNLKVEFSPSTLILRLYVDGVRVLENENLYVLAQNNYTRLYDTWNTSGAMYIDNLLITKTSFSKFFGAEEASSQFINYSIKTKNDLVDAVNGADEDTVLDILTSSVNADIIGIDTSNLSGLGDGETLAVKKYIKSMEYDDISDIKTAYYHISVYLDVVTADEDELSLKLSQYKDLLDIPDDNLYYEDSEIVGAIYSHLDEATSPEELLKMVTAYAIIYEIRCVDEEILTDNFDYLSAYGLRGDYASLSLDSKELIFSTMQDYTFDFTVSYTKVLKDWTEEINSLYDNAVLDSFDYIIKNESVDVIDSSIFLEGRVTPAVSYKFRATVIAGGSEIAFTEFTTASDGTYECEIKTVQTPEDRSCEVHIVPVEPEAENQYYFYDTFTAGERKGNYIVNKELYETPYNGKPSPSMCVAKEDGEERPRLLAGSGTIRDKTDGETLFIEADIMKAQNIASPKLWSITDYNGNKEAMTVKATASDIVLYYKDAAEGYITKTLIKDFKKIHWYNIKFAVSMTEGVKAVDVFVDNNKTLSFKLSADIPNIGRFFDSEALTVNSDVHYIDNIKCYVDKAFRINVSEDYVPVSVIGSEKISKAIKELSEAGVNGYIGILEGYSDIFGIDTSIVKNLKDSSAVDLNITSGKYSSVLDVRKLYLRECRLQQIKEADNTEKIHILSQYSEDFFVNVDVENNEYEKFLIENISDVKHSDDVQKFHNTISAGAELKSITQMTARDTVDKNSALLEERGMTNGYSNLNSSMRNAVALSVVSNMPQTYKIDDFLSAVVKLINDGVTNPKQPQKLPGGGGTSGGSVGNVTTSFSDTQTVLPTTFSDVPSHHWCYGAIEYLVGKKIINGMGNGIFSPEQSVKREEFVKMVLAALCQKLYDYEPTFYDVDEGMWYAPYAITASKLGIVSGMGNGCFGIGESITRQDAALILYRCLENLSADCKPVRNANVFADDDNISEYAKEAVYHLYKCNVINGMTETGFAPLEPLTRAQAAKLIYEIIG